MLQKEMQRNVMAYRSGIPIIKAKPSLHLMISKTVEGKCLFCKSHTVNLRSLEVVGTILTSPNNPKCKLIRTSGDSGLLN